MVMYLVTGSAGSGKSEVCRALKSKGYAAYDTDDDGLARWRNTQTGYIHPKSSVSAAMRTAEFIAMHEWIVTPEQIESLKRENDDKPVLVCGSVGNEAELRPFFNKVFALHVDDDTLCHRLLTRTTNDWGKQPYELKQTLEAHHNTHNIRKQNKDIIVDPCQPLEIVVNEIENYIR